MVSRRHYREHSKASKTLGVVFGLMLGMAGVTATPAIPQSAAPYFPPPESAGGWRKLEQPKEIRTLAGMDPDKLSELKDWLRQSDKRNFAAVVIRRGYIVLEEQRGVSSVSDVGRVASCSKAVCATVLAIAAERSRQGLTPRKMSFEDPAFEFLPWAKPLSDPRKARITVEQLLNHTSGLCPEAVGAPNDGTWEYLLGHSGDPRTARLAFDPGTACGYSSIAFSHAALVCENVTGKPYDQFAIEALFKPLGIEHWRFQFYEGGPQYGRHPSHGLGMPARDLARICYCLLREGRWNEQQVVPKWFVERTAAPTHKVKSPELRWKLNPEVFSDGWELPARLDGTGGRSGDGIPADARAKPGSGGQLIAFVPSLDLVVTRQTGNSGDWQFEEYLRRACAAVVERSATNAAPTRSGGLRASADGPHLLASPDQRLQVSLRLPAPDSSERPCWSAVFKGRLLLTNCTLGLQTAEAGELLTGARLVHARNRSEDQRIPVLFGKADHTDDRFCETRFTFETRQHRRLDVVFRCYNDAVAFRYELPKDAQARSVTVTDETTAFRVADNPTAYAQYLENYTTSHEHNVTPSAYRELRQGVLLDLPLTFSWTNDICMALTEASLRHYAGMALMRPDGATVSDELVCRLTPRPDGTKVVRALPMETPWRVVLVGDRPGALLESSTLYCLNEPSAIQDTSWIKPGKITFSWWNGDVYDGKPSLPILSVEMAKKYIDFCARNGIPTHSLTSEGQQPTSPWYFQSQRGVAPGPDTDVTRPRADFDLPAIRAYANSKGVRLWTWVHQGALRGRVEEAFTAFEQMGWSGMMVDFFDHDDQETIEFAEAILQAAARHHILIHFHGVWKPTGWQRTYPNLMNHEGALNLEYLKWSDRCTPEHNLRLAFTRLLAGPMDYHLGGFRAVPRAEFKPHPIAPNVLGTRGHQLAMYVCFDNPNPMLADYPTAYEGQPGFDFLKLVPTWWDETRILEGKVGEVLVTARRKGNTWYLGCLSAKQARDLALPLSFLKPGAYQTDLWRDAPNAEANPNHLLTETLNSSPSDTLRIHVAADGGFVARLTPDRN